MTDLKLYVRGFFGSKEMSTEALQSHRQTPIRSVFDLKPEALKHVVSNESVVEIYNQFIRRSVIHTDFDFRERVVKIALSAFGVNNFHAWALINRQSPTFTQTHADFISDTYRFIQTGKRHLSVDVWEKVIGPGSNDPSSQTEYDQAFLAGAVGGYSILQQRAVDGNLHNLIAQWLSHPGGFADLIITLYTCFGEHNTR